MTLFYYMNISFKNLIWSLPIDDADDEEEYKEDY